MPFAVKDAQFMNHELYELKRCTREKCEGAKLVKRKTKPHTASYSNQEFDYYQCPLCKTNYAYARVEVD